MTPAAQMGFKVGDKVKLKEDYYSGDYTISSLAEIFLKEDDGSTHPYFDTPQGVLAINLDRFLPACRGSERQEFKFNFRASLKGLEVSFNGVLDSKAIDAIIDIVRKEANLGK